MQIALGFLFLMLGSAYCTWDTKGTTKKLLRTNLNCPILTIDLCNTAEKEKNFLTNFDEDYGTTNFDLLRKNLRKDVIRKVNRCCNKFNNFEKKTCLKEVKETLKVGTWFDETDFLQNTDRDLLDRLDNIMENRDDKYTTWGDMIRETKDIRDDKYTTWTSDILNEDREDKYTTWTGDFLETMTDDIDTRFGGLDLGVTDDLLFTATTTDKWGGFMRRCNNCNQCRRRLERVTDITARKACTDNTLKNGRDTTTTCCKAGKKVGFLVGKENKDVCMPGWYKFQTKVQGCDLNVKPQCRRGFVTCCLEASKLAKDERTMTDMDTMDTLTRRILEKEL